MDPRAFFNTCRSLKLSISYTLNRNNINVSVLHHNPSPSIRTRPFFCLGGGVAAAVQKILVVDDLGLDEAALEIGVDLSGGLREPWCPP